MFLMLHLFELQQLSQFWYDEETINTLVKGAINSTKPNEKIALISCPSLYSAIKKNTNERQGRIAYHF